MKWGKRVQQICFLKMLINLLIVLMFIFNLIQFIIYFDVIKKKIINLLFKKSLRFIIKRKWVNYDMFKKFWKRKVFIGVKLWRAYTIYEFAWRC